MKAVFLDIDGVLLPFGEPPPASTEDAAPAQNEHAAGDEDKGRFTEQSLSALSRILSATGAQVVLSSTWRCCGGAEAVIEEFRLFAVRQQRRGGAPQDSSCPLRTIADKGDFEFITDPAMHSQRQWEIAAWLESAAAKGLEVQGWCALDDEELVSLDPALGGGDFNARFQHMFEGRHIKTPSNVGLTDKHVVAAIEALDCPYNSSVSGTDDAAPQQEGEGGGGGGRKRKWQATKVAGNELTGNEEEGDRKRRGTRRKDGGGKSQNKK